MARKNYQKINKKPLQEGISLYNVTRKKSLMVKEFIRNLSPPARLTIDQEKSFIALQKKAIEEPNPNKALKMIAYEGMKGETHTIDWNKIRL